MPALEKGCPSDAGRQRLRAHLLSGLVSLGRSTVTGMLCAQGKADRDWSADYRLYSEQRVDPSALLEVLRQQAMAHLPESSPLVIGMDDTLLRKRGRRIEGVSYRRDPLGPPFICNLILAQRFLQLSMALPQGDGGARMIPIDFCHAPTPKKPSRKAPDSAWIDYRQAQKKMKLTQVAVERMQHLHQQVTAERSIRFVGDGGYTNRTLLSGLPQKVTFIGRLRKDAQLYFPPQSQPLKGRKRRYGQEAPTPEQIRQDETIPWKRVRAFACGKFHDFRVKCMAPVRARIDRGQRDLQIVVIAPLGYRPNNVSRLLYRQPAYLLCTDPLLPLEELLQAYLWRWEIEVNFRDQKTLLGIGQAQVRNHQSLQHVPQLQVAAYALLLLASIRAFGSTGRPDCLPLPKWRNHHIPSRASTAQLLNQLRYELWASQLCSPHFSHFAVADPPTAMSQKCELPLASALFRAAA